MPGTTTEDLRLWAESVELQNPIGIGFEPFAPRVIATISDHPFAGVEITFEAGDQPIFTLALFATQLTEGEKEIMELER